MLLGIFLGAFLCRCYNEDKMKEKTKNTLTYLINLSFFLYFIILIVERVLSIVLSIANGINLYSDGFNGYTYTLVFCSIGGFLIYLVIFCRENIKALFNKPKSDVNFKNLCISSGILLLSGMVHTEYTIPVIQFISYGILILGILFKVIINVSSEGDKSLHWLSFAYLVSFSMAIPVMYRTLLDIHVLFHILEGVTSFLLVGVFTYFLILIFEGKNDLFYIVPLLMMVILDTSLVALRWAEEINYFVFIFLVLSFVIFVAGYIYKLNKKQ